MKQLRFANVVGPVPAPWEGSVAEVSAYKYRVFLACSPGDLAWGRWLRATLESFRIDRDIVGRQTPVGRLPKSLRPIFWDCADPATGAATSASVVAGILPAIQGIGRTTGKGVDGQHKAGHDDAAPSTPEDKRRQAQRA